MLIICIHSFILFVVINCESINKTLEFNETLVTEEKIIKIFDPLLVNKLWHRKSCLTYKTSIGTCLTLHECKARNGTVGGLCLGIYKICCQTKKIASNLSLNSRCITDSDKSGICLDKTDCVRRLGTPDGYCNTALLTCCRTETFCGKSIAQNETEFVNDLYPYPTTDSNVCQVIVEKQTNICQIRLDLLDLNLAQPDNQGKCTTDALMIKSPVGEQMPIICGDNSGQHLYIESGRNTNAKDIRFSIVTNGNQFRRKWRIRIVMIGCDSALLAPNGCLQYFTHLSDLVRSFNYGIPILGMTRYMSDLSYTVCVRVLENYCWIKWTPEYSDSFSWGLPLTWNQSISPFNPNEDLCSKDDFISVDEGITGEKYPEYERICGNQFLKYNYIISQTKPFQLKVRSNSKHTINSENSQNGFSLIYRQISCYDLFD